MGVSAGEADGHAISVVPGGGSHLPFAEGSAGASGFDGREREPAEIGFSCVFGTSAPFAVGQFPARVDFAFEALEEGASGRGCMCGRVRDSRMQGVCREPGAKGALRGRESHQVASRKGVLFAKAAAASARMSLFTAVSSEDSWTSWQRLSPSGSWLATRIWNVKELAGFCW